MARITSFAIITASLVLIATTMVAQAGSIIFVDDDAALGGDGTSWNTAYRFLQDALATASGGSIAEIHIAQGTYKPDRNEANPHNTGNRAATFRLLNGVALMGGYAGLGAKNPDARDIDLYTTILKGDLMENDGLDYAHANENALHVVTALDVDATAQLDGFTVQGGNANGDDPHDRGGGIYSSSASPQITDCLITENQAVNGGGMYDGVGAVQLTGCTFTANFAEFRGGGVYSLESSSTFHGCQFSSNLADHVGGAVRVYDSNLEFFACLFEENIGTAGGAIHSYESDTVIVNSVFRSNEASDPLGGGGAVVNTQYSDAVFVNCLFQENSGRAGGAVYTCCNSDSGLFNCTIVANTASDFGGGIACCCFADTVVNNTILWGNQAPFGMQIAVFTRALPGFAHVFVSYCDVDGGLQGVYAEEQSFLIWNDGNIDVYPSFVDHDYNIQPGSPCIDAGNNWGVPIDELDYDKDGVLCELFPFDLDGNPRFNADESDLDPGCGIPVVVDMGAYEYQYDPVEQVVFADLNSDGAVSMLDLLSLFAEWGECVKGCCLADLDLDGNVNTSDLLTLLANWGPCG